MEKSKIERLKELLLLVERYDKMIEKKQISEQEIQSALKIVKEEIEEIKRNK